MHSCKVILQKKCICDSHQDLNILNILIMSVASRKQFMALNRLLMHGTQNLKIIFLIWSDSSVFILNKFGSTVYILVYVDDVIVPRNQLQGIEHIIEALSNQFSLRDLGSLHYFLSIEVDMHNCKRVSTPMTSTIVFEPSPSDSLVDSSLYWRIIDKLHYLS
ncbi:Integrase core domain containing protein [Gossypium australe]|uniref:Integrase core domain containing protein n=1 Tax=Gossypium australe TaxID=47621 RepID=A0A5B6VTJ6_9ROSI|nr:Integrase core domain containing protein [Gossypium australe]